jgi:hypothetical protein
MSYDPDAAANAVTGFIHAALGVDIGKMGAPEDEADWDLAYEGIGLVAYHAGAHPEWDPDFHWSNWKQLVAEIKGSESA